MRENKNWMPPNPELSKKVTWTGKEDNKKKMMKKNPRGNWINKPSNQGEYYDKEYDHPDQHNVA